MKGIEKMEEIKKFEDRPIRIKRARKGSPCYWENNKEFELMNRMSFIYDSEGKEKLPIYIRKKTGEKLVPIVEGNYILKVFFEKNRPVQLDRNEVGDGIGVSILRIKEISKYKNTAQAEIVERKPSDSTKWVLNDSAFPISEEIKAILLLKIKNLLHF